MVIFDEARICKIYIFLYINTKGSTTTTTARYIDNLRGRSLCCAVIGAENRCAYAVCVCEVIKFRRSRYCSRNDLDKVSCIYYTRALAKLIWKS